MKKSQILSILLFAALLLTACEGTPTPNVEKKTPAALEATLATQPTGTPIPPTDTAVPPTATSTPVPPTSTPTPVPPTLTPTPVPPTATSTPVPPTPTLTPPKAILGYAEDIPAAFVQPASGLVIEILEVTYAETGALERYKENVKHASGEVLELEFYDFVHTETGLVDGYTASINGAIIRGPNKKEFESISEIETKIAFAPDHFQPVISVACTGQVESNVEFAYTEEGAQQVARHELLCNDQQRTYDLQYSEYTYDEFGRLSGFSVRVEILPID